MKEGAARARSVAALAAALACIGTASAQVTSCRLTDHECVQREYPQVCFDAASKLKLEPCLAWLGEIEQSPSTDVRSSAAAIYGLIAPQAGELRADLQQRSAELVHAVLDEDPRHPGALLSFASMAETNEERVVRLRDVLAVDPENRIVIESLARALLSIERGGLEAAALYERAYETQESRGTGRAWRFARDAIWSYERAGAPERASRLREQVVADYDLPAKLEGVADATASDAANLRPILQELCDQVVMSVFGGRPCLDGIERAVEATDRARARGNAAVLEHAVSDAMFKAAVSGMWLDAADSKWRTKFEAALERYDGPQAVARLRTVLPEILIE